MKRRPLRGQVSSHDLAWVLFWFGLQNLALLWNLLQHSPSGGHEAGAATVTSTGKKSSHIPSREN
jgi:hypothetical protein